jgi:hypothetical protein
MGEGYRQRNGSTTLIVPQVMASMSSHAYRIRVGRSVPSQGSSTVVNRVYDSVAAKTVTWETGTPDKLGIFYPGPGVFGVTTSNYAVTGKT